MYLTFGEYIQFHKDVSEADFRLLEARARKIFNNLTTGVDGVCKLEEHFPNGEDIKFAMAELIHELYQFNEADKASGFVMDGDVYRGRQIASVSAGGESISYTHGQSSYSLAGAERDKYIVTKATELLRGLKDNNGVPLLYGGAYVR